MNTCSWADRGQTGGRPAWRLASLAPTSSDSYPKTELRFIPPPPRPMLQMKRHRQTWGAEKPRAQAVLCKGGFWLLGCLLPFFSDPGNWAQRNWAWVMAPVSTFSSWTTGTCQEGNTPGWRQENSRERTACQPEAQLHRTGSSPQSQPRLSLRARPSRPQQRPSPAGRGLRRPGGPRAASAPVQLQPCDLWAGTSSWDRWEPQWGRWLPPETGAGLSAPDTSLIYLLSRRRHQGSSDDATPGGSDAHPLRARGLQFWEGPATFPQSELAAWTRTRTLW